MTITELKKIFEEEEHDISPILDSEVTYDLLFRLLTNAPSVKQGRLLRGLISRCPEYRKDIYQLYIDIKGESSGVDIGWQAVWFPELKEQERAYHLSWCRRTYGDEYVKKNYNE